MNRSELTEANIESGREDAPSGWQPIESAPKDGTPFLIYQPKRAESDRIMVAYRYSPSSRTDDILSLPGLWGMRNATHWAPLPAAPDGGAGVPVHAPTEAKPGSEQDLILSLTKEVGGLREGVELAISTIDAALYAARAIGSIDGAAIMERDLEKLRALSTSGRAEA